MEQAASFDDSDDSLREQDDNVDFAIESDDSQADVIDPSISAAAVDSIDMTLQLVSQLRAGTTSGDDLELFIKQWRGKTVSNERAMSCEQWSRQQQIVVAGYCFIVGCSSIAGCFSTSS